MSEDLTKDSLQKSVKIVGELYPVLTNQDGKILDGSHRIESNPTHYRKIIQTKNRTEEILIRVHAHHRRQVPQEETKAMLIELAKELEKDGIPKENVTTELYKLVPYTEQYVRRLLPEMYKRPEKVEAGKVSAQLVAQTVKISETEKVACPKCHKVFDSEFEYRILHWPHNHPGPAPAPLKEGIPAVNLTEQETPASTSSTEPEPKKTMVPQPTPEGSSLVHTFTPKNSLNLPHEEPEIEVYPEGTPVCPCCEASLNLSEYEEIKRKVKTKYGIQVQTLLFPSTAK